MSIKIRYFAWVREKIGKSEETLDLPHDTETVADVVAWLQTRGPEYADAFAHPAIIRVALDQVHVQSTAPVAAAREIAFFPPVTGG